MRMSNKRQIDIVLKQFSSAVKQQALTALHAHGFIGLDICNNAPNTLIDLKDFYYQPPNKRPARFPVFDGGSEKTVYETPLENYLQRAWHDLLHITLDAKLDLEGEKIVCAAQQKLLCRPIDKLIMYADIIEQTKYFEAFGAYPEDQRAFVIDKVFPDEPIYPAVYQPAKNTEAL